MSGVLRALINDVIVNEVGCPKCQIRAGLPCRNMHRAIVSQPDGTTRYTTLAHREIHREREVAWRAQRSRQKAAAAAAETPVVGFREASS